MIREYFVQFGIIIFPIAIYQMIVFGRSYTELPMKTWVMGLYGGGAAILSQMMPVHILSQPENFQCVPVILSILYGKRRAGMLAVGILSLYQFIALPLVSVVPAVIAIAVYSVIPMVICEKFERYPRQRRFLILMALTVVTLVVEIMFLYVYFLIAYGDSGFSRLSGYEGFLAIACLIQLALMSAAFFLMEHIIESAQVRQRYQSLIDYNPVGICAFDAKNEIMSMNAAFETITGYTEAELVGKSRLQLWFEEDHLVAENVLNDLYRGEIKKNFEASIRHKDGRKVEVRATMVPMVEGDKVRGYFSMITDIAEEKMAETLLLESEKLAAIGQLAAGVAHEIRNPLTSIKGFVHLLSEKAAAADQSYYDVVKSELSRVEGIVSEMLVLAKPQAVCFKPVSVGTKVQEVANLLSAQANMQSVSVSIESDVQPLEDLSPVAVQLQPMGDGNQLKQVFLNLVKNSIEAMPHGGNLSIRIQHRDGKVTVTFADTGEGMTPEALAKLGEPFYTTKVDGTGLGLVVSKRIIANHFGQMEIQSTPGLGTMVTVSLPLPTPSHTPLPTSSRQTPGQSASRLPSASSTSSRQAPGPSSTSSRQAPWQSSERSSEQSSEEPSERQGSLREQTLSAEPSMLPAP